MLTFRVALLTGVSLISTAAWAGDPPNVVAVPLAEFQDSEAQDPASASQIDDVIVTAQRRTERVQDIPVAISAIGAEEIQKAGVVSFEQVAPRTPSFYFGSFGAARPQLYIRGIGTRSFDPGSESSVGVFVDDVYMGRSTGSFGSLKDIQRIEVIRGPQGTLYGRNTIGGAINVLSNEPTRDMQGRVEAGISNFNGYDFQGAVGGPVTADGNLMFRLAGWRSSRDGYVTNLTTGNTFQGVDNIGGRLRLRYEPSEQLRFDLIAEFGHDGDGAAFGGLNQGTGPSSAGAPANPRAVFFSNAGRAAMSIPPAADLRSGFLNYDPTLDRNAQTYVGRIEYDFGGATLTSISGLRKLEVDDTRDLDGSSIDTLGQISGEQSDQFTQEFRLTSNSEGSLSFGGRLDWILGAFYYKDESDRFDVFQVGVDSVVRFAAGTPATDITFLDFESESYAYFGQATLHITDALDLTIGGRYTKDDKTATQSGTTTDALPVLAAPFSTTNSASYDSFDPRVVLTYEVTPDVNVYASYSTGFKSGGFQFVPFTAAQANVLFNPEDITTYEVGLKSEFFDRRLRFNTAAYYYEYQELQVSRIIDAGGAPVSLITNAASSTIKGLDVEIVARPTPNLDLSLAYGYLDAKYDDYVFNATTNFSGTTLVRAPEHSFNLGGEYRIPVGSEDNIAVRVDYAYTSDFFHEPGQGNNVFGSGIPLTAEEGYGLLDLRVAYETPAWRASVYVTNATDEEYRRTVNALGSTVVGFAGQPRTYGVRLAYEF